MKINIEAKRIADSDLNPVPVNFDTIETLVGKAEVDYIPNFQPEAGLVIHIRNEGEFFITAKDIAEAIVKRLTVEREESGQAI